MNHFNRKQHNKKEKKNQKKEMKKKKHLENILIRPYGNRYVYAFKEILINLKSRAQQCRYKA